MPLIVVIAAILLAWLAGAWYGEVGVRVVGGVFEGLGVALVLARLVSVRRLLGREIAPRLSKPWRWFRDWWRRRRSTKIPIGGSATINLEGVGLAGRATSRPPDSAGIDEKFAAVWRALENANSHIDEVAKKSAEDLEAARTKLRAEIERSERAINQVVEKLSTVAAGDQLDVLGVVCVLAGLTLATFSSELVHWVG